MPFNVDATGNIQDQRQGFSVEDDIDDVEHGELASLLPPTPAELVAKALTDASKKTKAELIKQTIKEILQAPIEQQAPRFHQMVSLLEPGAAALMSGALYQLIVQDTTELPVLASAVLIYLTTNGFLDMATKFARHGATGACTQEGVWTGVYHTLTNGWLNQENWRQIDTYLDWKLPVITGLTSAYIPYALGQPGWEWGIPFGIGAGVAVRVAGKTCEWVAETALVRAAAMTATNFLGQTLGFCGLVAYAGAAPMGNALVTAGSAVVAVGSAAYEGGKKVADQIAQKCHSGGNPEEYHRDDEQSSLQYSTTSYRTVV